MSIRNQDEVEESPSNDHLDDFKDDLEDDLSAFDWESAKQQETGTEKEDIAEEMDVEDLLGGFLANMNK